MFITNTNIFQPRILPKPELNETLPKTNLKIIQPQKKCPSAEGLGIKKSVGAEPHHQIRTQMNNS